MVYGSLILGIVEGQMMCGIKSMLKPEIRMGKG
jgi:hypothetical protein